MSTSATMSATVLVMATSLVENFLQELQAGMRGRVAGQRRAFKHNKNNNYETFSAATVCPDGGCRDCESQTLPFVRRRPRRAGGRMRRKHWQRANAIGR